MRYLLCKISFFKHPVMLCHTCRVTSSLFIIVPLSLILLVPLLSLHSLYAILHLPPLPGCSIYPQIPCASLNSSLNRPNLPAHSQLSKSCLDHSSLWLHQFFSIFHEDLLLVYFLGTHLCHSESVSISDADAFSSVPRICCQTCFFIGRFGFGS